jgi:hypothetical protein
LKKPDRSDGGQHYAQHIEDQFGQRVLFLVEGCTDGVPDAQGNKTDWQVAWFYQFNALCFARIFLLDAARRFFT